MNVLAAGRRGRMFVSGMDRERFGKPNPMIMPGMGQWAWHWKKPYAKDLGVAGGVCRDHPALASIY